tara:strand:- start:7324 stop:8181 length:858 start_codon:yes stop_codon:yes gene_type:complete
MPSAKYKRLLEVLREYRSGPTPAAVGNDGLMDAGILAAIITLHESPSSIAAARVCIDSIRNTKSKIHPWIYPAVTPKTLPWALESFGLNYEHWVWPTKPGGIKNDFKSGLEMHAYGAKDQYKVIACMLSHMMMWRYCVMFNQPAIMLEHDAIFTRQFNIRHLYEKPINLDGKIIALNNPIGATRKSQLYYDKIVNSVSPRIAENNRLQIVQVPEIDKISIPQGLPGNSAYIITPNAAMKLLELIGEYGMMPNDALMCRQLMGQDALRITYPFFTELQGVRSTTQG